MIAHRDLLDRLRHLVLVPILPAAIASPLLGIPQPATAHPALQSVDAGALAPAPMPPAGLTSLPDGLDRAVPTISRSVPGAGSPAAWPWLPATAVASLTGRAVAERGSRSGLPWASGAACGGAGFEAFRGRRQDVQTTFAPFNNWASMVAYFTNKNPQKLARSGIPLSVGLGLLTQQSRGQLAACGTGAFDTYFRQIGASLAGQGQGGISIRLGWEANSDSFPWAIGMAPDAFKSCFRQVAGVLHRASPGLNIEWHNARKGKLAFSNTRAYPGDDVVDDVALSYYDRTQASTTEAVWAMNYNLTTHGGPAGLGPWLAFAQARGKKLSLSEWGISNGAYDGFDNPLFVRKMYEFFAAHAGSIRYESYFNCPSSGGAHVLSPGNRNPRASAMYKSLWSTGRPAAERAAMATGRD